MYNELLNENIIIDLQKLVNSVNVADTELSDYAKFMKEQILSVTGNN